MKRLIAILILPLLLQSNYVSATEQIDNSASTQATQVEHVEGRTSHTIFFDASIFATGVAIGLILFLLYSRRVVRGILSSDWNKYRNGESGYLLDQFRAIEMLKASRDDKKQKLEALVKENADQKQGQSVGEQGALRGPIAAGTPEQLQSEPTPKPLVTEWSPPRSAERTNGDDPYFSIPGSEGTFKIALGNSLRSHDSFYRIHPTESGETGVLYFLSGEYDGRALGNITDYLNPVCEIENIEDRIGAQRIVVISPGRVVKNGDFWKIDDGQKVKIRLA
jgi:hypothetical protein